MRWLDLVVALFAILLALVAATAVHILTALDDRSSAALIEPLTRGDLVPLLTSPFFWSAFPSLGFTAGWSSLGPAILIAAFGIALLIVARRHPDAPRAVLGLAALSSAVVPYAVGALALRGNADPGTAGVWLAWMVFGPLYASVLALGWLTVGGLQSRIRNSISGPNSINGRLPVVP